MNKNNKWLQYGLYVLAIPAVINVICSFIVNAIPHNINSGPDPVAVFVKSSNAWQLGAFLVVVSLIVPLIEEVFYRKFLWTISNKFLSQRNTLYVIAILFALSHGKPYLVAGLMPFSLYLSYLRAKYDSIKPTYIAHCIFNIAGTLYVLV